jgi:Zinc-finger of C2H2 type
MECSLCDKRFFDETTLQHHIETVHETCDICRGRFTSEVAVKAHKYYVHECCAQCKIWCGSVDGWKQHQVDTHNACYTCMGSPPWATCANCLRKKVERQCNRVVLVKDSIEEGLSNLQIIKRKFEELNFIKKLEELNFKMD